jgi:hypothetical protein
MNPHQFGNVDCIKQKSDSGSTFGSASNKHQVPDLHLDPHQSDKLDLEPNLDPNPFTEDRPKCME